MPDGTTTSNEYSINDDAFGRRETHTAVDANRHATQRRFDAFGRLHQVIEFAGNCGWFGVSCGGAWQTHYSEVSRTRYSYDSLDQLITVQDAQNNETAITYDTLGQKTRMHDPDMGIWRYGYHPSGTLAWQTDANGQTTNFGYDALDRLTTQVPLPRFSDEFNTNQAAAWNWSPHQTVPHNDGGEPVVRSVGTGTGWQASFARSSFALTHGQRMTVRFKLESLTTQAHFVIEADDPTLRRFGVVVQGTSLVVQTATNGTSTLAYPATLLTNVQPNRWYVLDIAVDDVTGFGVRVADASNPTIQGSFRTPMPRGHAWRFVHYIWSSAALLDTYHEFAGPVLYTGYDDTTAPNHGRGRRTSTCVSDMVHCIVFQRWEYDARGRVTFAGQNVNGPFHHYRATYDSADRRLSTTYEPTNEVVTQSYDAAGRGNGLCTTLGGCYVQNASYTALNQPQIWNFGNGVVQTWHYDAPMARTGRIQLGSAPNTGGFFDLHYTYDAVGNLRTYYNQYWQTTLTYGYDHRDRLTSVMSSGGSLPTNETTTYDVLGNIRTKNGVTYTYPDAGQARPHAVTQVGAHPYSYDANGNVLSGGGRTYRWSVGNQPLQISHAGGSEAYLYDADGQRAARAQNGQVHYFFGGVWEQVGSEARPLYMLDGQVVAQRASHGVTYLHRDRLGSVAMITGTETSGVEYDAWGVQRFAGLHATTLNYTGQRRDKETGLLYYNARYYDPVLGRFISPDSVVPGDASGGMAGVALKPLTVDFHEPGFVATLNGENQLPFWFEMTGEQQREAGSPWGPANPQSLNRYAYVQNNPLRWTDPTGHWTISINIGGELFAGAGGRGQYSIVIDGTGEIAGTYSVGMTGHVNIGGSFGPTVTITNAPSVYDLQGKSVSLGVHLGQVADVNVEALTFKSNDIRYYGGTVGTSATLKGIPIDVYGAGDHTEIVFRANPIRFLENVYNEGYNRLRQSAGIPMP
jgi:RHS repeat-associated protein